MNRTMDNPLSIDVITNTALPITVHERPKLNELMPNKFDLMAYNGAFLTNAKDQYAAYPDLFMSEKAVKRAWEHIKSNKPQMTIIDYIIAKWGKLNCVNPPLTHRVKYKVKGARGAAKDFVYHDALVGCPLKWLRKNIDKNIELYNESEALEGVSYSKANIVQPSLKPSKVNVLSAPDLPVLEPLNTRVEKEGVDAAQIYTIEDVAEWFNVDDEQLQALKKKYKKFGVEQEQKIACYIMNEAVQAAHGIYALKALPGEFYKSLNATRLAIAKAMPLSSRHVNK